MPDYFSRFIFATVGSLVWGLFYEFMFRRSEDRYMRSLSKYTGIAWGALTVWTIYNFIMWRIKP